MNKLMLVMTLFVTLGFSNAANAQTVSGMWGGRSPSSLSILSKNKVKYCFGADCITRTVIGSTDTAFSFNWNTAKFRFTKNGNTYNGTYVNGSDRSAIVMK